MNVPSFDQRSFIKTSAGLGAVLLVTPPCLRAWGAQPALTVGTRTIEVNKKAATVFSVLGPNGKPGLIASEGDWFSLSLHNNSTEPLPMHWHGQVHAPADQDRSRPGGGALAIGASDNHDFELTRGTHWMHAHALSEQQLLAAPMIALERDAGDVQEVVMMLHDFTFRTPQEILAELTKSEAHAGHGNASKKAMAGTHANDVAYDAILANDRTLDDPDVIRVEKNGRARMRMINGATATTFFISTPRLVSQCLSVDGSSCQPVTQAAYPLAPGQRIDLLVAIPKKGSAYPIVAQVEAERFLTGIVLATAGALVTKLSTTAEAIQGPTSLAFESRLQALTPIVSKPADKTFGVKLGEGPGYRWMINGQVHGEHQPFDVRIGDRVEMTFANPTTMMHPMHLHGHHFQVVAIGSERLVGAMRDTVIVPPQMTVTVAFDAAKVGSWYLHCHHLYHMASGMMTEVRVS
jgi:FtsP/CotA-like multicopper oxidase with cupredoxin domain